MLAGSIGIIAGQEPLVCASTGQEVRGRHANTYSIEGTNVYYRVLAKAVPAWDADINNHIGMVEAYKLSLAPALKRSVSSPDTSTMKEVK